MKSEECAPSLPPPLMPPAAPTTASAVLPKNVGQDAAYLVEFLLADIDLHVVTAQYIGQ